MASFQYITLDRAPDSNFLDLLESGSTTSANKASTPAIGLIPKAQPQDSLLLDFDPNYPATSPSLSGCSAPSNMSLTSDVTGQNPFLSNFINDWQPVTPNPNVTTPNVTIPNVNIPPSVFPIKTDPTGGTPNIPISQTVPSPPKVEDVDYSNLSPDFLLARNEALCLGLQGDQLANYVLAKTKPVQTIINNTSATPTVSGPHIRLEKWKKEEKFETFIHRFERLASDLNWSDSTKLLHFISCLEGKALEIYRRCDRERRVTYEELRKQLDQAFAETAQKRLKSLMSRSSIFQLKLHRNLRLILRRNS